MGRGNDAPGGTRVRIVPEIDVSSRVAPAAVPEPPLSRLTPSRTSPQMSITEALEFDAIPYSVELLAKQRPERVFGVSDQVIAVAHPARVVEIAVRPRVRAPLRQRLRNDGPLIEAGAEAELYPQLLRQCGCYFEDIRNACPHVAEVQRVIPVGAYREERDAIDAVPCGKADHLGQLEEPGGTEGCVEVNPPAGGPLRPGPGPRFRARPAPWGGSRARAPRTSLGSPRRPKSRRPLRPA